MKPSDQFNAFRDLQELTGASDQELAMLLSRACGGYPTANYEDAMSEVLLRWLRHMTATPWVRAFQNGSRPDAPLTEVDNGQYGTIFLLAYDPVISPTFSLMQRIDPNTNEPSDDFCEEVSILGKYTFQLDVYRDAGEGNRSQTTSGIQSLVGSAFDVLLRAKTRMFHQRMRVALKQYCLQYNSNALSSIRNLPPELIKNTYETRATATLEIYASPVSKMRVPTTDFVPFEIEECDIEEPEPEIIEC